MTKELIILALILLVIYLYYQKPSETAKTYFELDSQETEIKELKNPSPAPIYSRKTKKK